MGLKASWINFLYKFATGTKKLRTILTPVGAIVFGVFTLLFIVIAVKVDKLLNLPAIINDPLDLYIFLILIIPGGLLTGWSVLHFLRVKGTPVPINPPPQLVNSGPYSITRNPMLTGIFLLLFGIGFGIGSFSLVFIFTPLFILINTLELKLIEEPELEKRLGDEYLNYKMNTPMFIPGLKFSIKGKE